MSGAGAGGGGGGGGGGTAATNRVWQQAMSMVRKTARGGATETFLHGNPLTFFSDKQTGLDSTRPGVEKVYTTNG